MECTHAVFFCDAAFLMHYVTHLGNLHHSSQAWANQGEVAIVKGIDKIERKIPMIRHDSMIRHQDNNCIYRGAQYHIRAFRFGFDIFASGYC